MLFFILLFGYGYGIEYLGNVKNIILGKYENLFALILVVFGDILMGWLLLMALG